MSTFKLLNFLFIISISTSKPSCKDSTNFCNHCNILTNLCAKCEKSDILVPDLNGGCIGAQKCFVGQNYCLECDTDGKLCKQCEENYYQDENGGCTYTGGCEISFQGECLKCKNDFILIGKENDIKICKYLLNEDYRNCNKINYETGFCDECKKGYFLTSQNFKCIKIENCKESIFENCISCNQDYYLYKKENKCIRKNVNFRYCKQTIDGENCDICDDGYFLDENGICINTQYCLESENFICKKCKSGYYLSNNNICTITDNCYTADNIISTCIYCKDEYYLDVIDYKCKSNLDDPYKYCQKGDKNECLKCLPNYYLGEDLKCSFSLYCSESENGECKLFKTGYHLSLNKICTNIEKCIISGIDSCIECEEGYYFNQFNKTCSEMQNQFLNCKFSCVDRNECCECKDNFYLFKNDSLCYDNTKEEAFIKCAIVDKLRENCIKCIEGYYLGKEDQKCSKVEHCKKVENKECIECETFYCLDIKKQRCIDNDYLEDINDMKYISCNRTNEEGTTCQQCINSYELNKDGYCVDIDYCEEKKDGKCIKCKDIISDNNYSFCANEIFGCLESAEDNCLRCDNLDNLYECTECKEGYYKKFKGCRKSED